MLSRIQVLWKAPKVNPLNHKALSVPVLNPVNKYGRTFFFSTFGFMIAFLSWYAFPPLITKTIKKDLHLSQDDVANSNIMALVATLLVRLIVGPLCDRYGPRYVFIGILLSGSIPTVLAGTVTSAPGLLVLRFFVGILGGSFVPCQVWSTNFYDTKVVGTANGLMAGIGNAGGGITYFVMPAVFDSLVANQGLTPHKAWRVSFVVPFILITATALGMLFLCEDTPTGPWSERHLHATPNHQADPYKAPSPSSVADGPTADHPDEKYHIHLDEKKTLNETEAGTTDFQTVAAEDTSGGLMFKLRAMSSVVFSLQALMLGAPYACSFGGELAINSILGAYYAKNFPDLGQTKSGQLAAMFGLLNVVFRPAGGIISDIFYRHSGSVQAKKIWLVFAGVMMGVFCIVIGVLDSHDQATMVGLVVGLAFFMDAANGANFAVVPHVFPAANGVLSGFVGAFGNLGGVIFAIVFRFNKLDYGRSIWILGIVMIAVNLGVSWIRPIPRSQR